MEQMTLYLDGEEVAHIEVESSQMKRVKNLFRKLATYANQFEVGFQYRIEDKNK